VWLTGADAMSALPIDYISARGSRMVISPVGSRDKLELKLRRVRALQGPMIEGEFYNQFLNAS
jgi:hypothetical protein